ncbi:helicase, partial [Streptosporangium sp. NPDC048865]|uniref:HelD family protein n=1 Tax=Streptosporangium sp. NPDC048865 TaxID=3155766 RepID=UPI0034374705
TPRSRPSPSRLTSTRWASSCPTLTTTAGRLAGLRAAENRLCFGRLDLRDGERRHIGRVALHDEDHEPLLVDWRAPAARPFYLATAAAPDGVRRRRHIRTRRRTVVAVSDEILDPGAADAGRGGEAALLAALDAGRTGRMGDIVETIQAEQDRVIRCDHRGVLVVQGGPGTGKTVVALHRAAYLLYTHREVLDRRGVLIVGPNATFLRYIGQVLPSLGETGVLAATVGELYPGVEARREEAPEVIAIKGRAEMAGVVAAAVRDRQWVPGDALEVVTDDMTLRLDRAACLRARDAARRSMLPGDEGRTHNQAAPIAAREIVRALVREVAVRLGDDLLTEADLDLIRDDLREDPGVLRAIDAVWPVLTPQRLIEDLFAVPERLARAAPALTPAERALLRRDPGGGWSPADVPLLDEAAELLGEDTSAERAAARLRHRRRVAYAQGVLDISHGSRPTDLEEGEVAEILTAADLLDAERLAERHEESDARTTAERAAADRTWSFGHVIVDEAQELSPMAWRLLMRRCPGRWMTLVGDVAQTGDPAGASSWQEVLGPYVGERWRLAELTVNYRVPAEIAALAAEVLGALGVGLTPPRPVRGTGTEPWRARAGSADAVADLVAREAAALGDGRLAVIVPTGRLAELGARIAAALPE